MTPMRAVLTLAIAAAATLGCEGGTGPEDLAGTYALVSVNGSILPAVVFEGTATDPFGGEHGFIAEVLEGALTLRADGTYSVRLVHRQTIDGFATTSEDDPSGTFTTSVSSITFTDAEDLDDVVSGSISGGTISVTVSEEEPDADGGELLVIYVFQK